MTEWVFLILMDILLPSNGPSERKTVSILIPMGQNESNIPIFPIYPDELQ